MLRAPAGVTSVYASVGLALLVQQPLLVHTFVSLGVPRSRVHRAYFPGAGIASLLADASVAVVRSDVGITQLVSPASHVFTLGQHCKWRTFYIYTTE